MTVMFRVAIGLMMLVLLAACGGGGGSSSGGGGGGGGSGADICPHTVGYGTDVFSLGDQVYADGIDGATASTQCTPQIRARLQNPGPYGVNDIRAELRILDADSTPLGGWVVLVEKQATIIDAPVIAHPDAANQANIYTYEGEPGGTDYCIAAGGTVTIASITASIGGTVVGFITDAGTSWEQNGSMTCPTDTISGSFQVTFEAAD